MLDTRALARDGLLILDTRALDGLLTSDFDFKLMACRKQKTKCPHSSTSSTRGRLLVLCTVQWAVGITDYCMPHVLVVSAFAQSAAKRKAAKVLPASTGAGLCAVVGGWR
jgi:hypothetical protein